MSRSLRRATALVALSALIAACGPQTQAAVTVTQVPPTAAPTTAPTATPAPTNTPEPTAVPTLAKKLNVAGVDVGGLDLEAARSKLASAVDTQLEPLEVYIGKTELTIKPDEITLAPDIDTMLTNAEKASSGDEVPLALSYDTDKLRTLLDTTAKQAASEGDSGNVIRNTEAISASFVLAGAQQLDLDAALKTIDTHLTSVDYTKPLTLELSVDPSSAARPTAEQLQNELDAMAEEFGGILGVSVIDLKSGDEIATHNKGTAFSTASTIKVAILTSAYAHVESFSAKQVKAMEAMIIDSDNLKANDVLAAGAGGTSTESAFEGAALMSEMLADIGLPTTYQYTPFEANDFIKLYKPKYQVGPKTAGDKPYTNSSRVQRTTPHEMAQLYKFIDECTQGKGILTEKFPETMTAERCSEMVDLLKRNADKSRMVSGLPKDADVAHKSGWAQPEVQGDAGIVRSPGGDFIISVYAYQSGTKYPDKFVQRLLGNVTRLVYTYYNPLSDIPASK